MEEYNSTIYQINALISIHIQQSKIVNAQNPINTRIDTTVSTGHILTDNTIDQI